MFIDRKKIDKVLYNLLSNAFKFTPKGGCIILSLAEDEKRRKCILSVKDSGIGIETTFIVQQIQSDSLF